MWYMFQGRGRDIDAFLEFFRAGDYDAYLEYINESIGGEYDDDWGRWIENPGAVLKRFTDDPIRPGVTPVRAVHFTELRARIERRARAPEPHCCPAAASASSARAPPSIRGIEWCPSWQAYSHMSSSSRSIGTS